LLASVRGFAVEAIQFKNHGNTEFFVGENKVITPKQQSLGIIFYIFKMAVAIAFLCKKFLLFLSIFHCGRGIKKFIQKKKILLHNYLKRNSNDVVGKLVIFGCLLYVFCIKW
jgi:hypothetical protein